MDLTAKIAATREVCTSALRDPPLNALAEELEGAGPGGSLRGCALLRSVAAAQDRPAALLSILRQSNLAPEFAHDDRAGIQRALLLRAALESLDRLDTLPVDPSVRSMFCDEFQFFARPSPRDMRLFQADSHTFLALSKIALLERFPAGEFHWEVSGVPRSWLFKVPWSSLPRVSHFIATRLKGFSPCFFPHVATRRRNPSVLFEKECDKAWHRIARSVMFQPDIKGLVASSWLHSTDTFTVSPHLSFLNRPFVESGAIVTTMGRADEEAGFLTGSTVRRRLYESGEFNPTLGLVLWSRDQMIRWVRSHPELDET